MGEKRITAVWRTGQAAQREKGEKKMKVRDMNQYIEVDVEGSLARFAGMESMYVRFLKKFPEDRTYDALKQAVQEKNQKETEMYAHTLKGICGNLGLTGLYRKSDELVKAVREGRSGEIEPLYGEIRALMEETVRVLKELE